MRSDWRGATPGGARLSRCAAGGMARTAAVQAVTDGPRYEETARLAGLPVSRKVPFNDAAAMRAAVDGTVAAVIVEPIQGLTGARDCDPGVPAAPHGRRATPPARS